ncbi:MAG: hypothetical protein MJK12_17250 [Colwellia sp.]|nr:hypothetical protein [Colwellia sp.]
MSQNLRYKKRGSDRTADLRVGFVVENPSIKMHIRVNLLLSLFLHSIATKILDNGANFRRVQ